MEDAAAIAAITDAAYSKYIPLLGRKPQPMTADYARMVTEDSIWLLHLDDLLVGLIVLVLEAEAMLIYSVVVHPEYQGRGLGHRLLAWAEEEACRAGYASIRLYTNTLFVDNVRLYHSIGYHDTGLEPYLGSTLVHMAKPLE